jgi:opacity protein-like surface antigen
MKFPASCAGALLFSAALCVVSAGAARAADMPFLSSPAAIDDTPVEFATGWYLRGDVGYSNISSPTVIGDLINSSVRTGSISGSLGAGYQYNSWLRTEIALDRSVIRPNAVSGPFWCPYANHPLSSQDQYENGVLVQPSQTIGYGVDPNETCVSRTTGNLSRTTGLFNAYADLGEWYGFTPYIGAGVGVSYVRTSGAINYFKTSDGTPYAADLSPVDGYPLVWVNKDDGKALDPQPMLAFAQQYWDRSRAKSSWKFAWALFAGVSYDLTQSIKVDLGYRYLNSGKYVGLAGSSGATASPYDLVSHEVRVGVRLTTD